MMIFKSETQALARRFRPTLSLTAPATRTDSLPRIDSEAASLGLWRDIMLDSSPSRLQVAQRAATLILRPSGWFIQAVRVTSAPGPAAAGGRRRRGGAAGRRGRTRF